MENYAKCEKTEAWETAKIQWKNLTNIWSIIGEKSAVKTEYIERNKMCRDENYRYYTGQVVSIKQLCTYAVFFFKL